MLLPPDMREWLPDDHLAWLVLDVVGQLDLSRIESQYRLGWAGRRAYDPVMLTALLVYAYCCGERSSRRIETGCLTDVAFRVISGQQRPDHSTISRFRATHAQALADLFGQVLAICSKAGLGKVGLVAVDGTKIAANASEHRNRDEDRLRQMATDILAEAEQVDDAEDAEHGVRRGDELPASLRPGTGRADRIKAALESIQAEKADRVRQDIDRTRRKLDRARSSMDTARRRSGRIHAGRAYTRTDRRPIDEHQEVKVSAAKIAAAEAEMAAAQAGDGPASSTGRPPQRNTTDPDSRLMKNKSKGFLQGFNAQVAVSDDHLIVATDVTCSSNDMNSFIPMMDLAVASVSTHFPAGAGIGTLLADAGYCSSENLTSPGPDRLIATGRDPAKPSAREPIQKMADRLAKDSPDRATYRRRQAIVEPVIGHLKDRIGLRRFTRRGLEAARHELALAATAHNIRRLATV